MMKTSEFSKFLDQNKKPLAALAAVLVVVILGTVLWQNARAGKNREANNLLAEIQNQARPLITVKSFDAAAKLYEPLFAKYPGSRAAYEGELQLGDLRMDAEQFDRAATHYANAAKMASDDFGRVLARYNLGIAEESGKKYQEAVLAYEDALQAKGSEFLRPEILMAQARCYEALNQKDKAVALYKTVQEKYAAKTYYSGAASAYEKQLKN